MYVPVAFVDQAKLKAAVQRVAKRLRPDVVDVSFTLGDDWSGSPSIFFMVILSNSAASQRDKLFDVTDRVSKMIVHTLQPSAEWGVYPYFSFRSEAEQAEINQRALAS